MCPTPCWIKHTLHCANEPAIKERLGMPTTLAATFCERFLQPAQRLMATTELIAKGEGAIPILEAILDGRACNQWSIAYLQLGMPLDCALAAAARLAEVARPLEPLLRDTLSAHNPCYAIMALGALGQMEEETRHA